MDRERPARRELNVAETKWGDLDVGGARERHRGAWSACLGRLPLFTGVYQEERQASLLLCLRRQQWYKLEHRAPWSSVTLSLRMFAFQRDSSGALEMAVPGGRKLCLKRAEEGFLIACSLK